MIIIGHVRHVELRNIIIMSRVWSTYVLTHILDSVIFYYSSDVCCNMIMKKSIPRYVSIIIKHPLQ